MSLPKLAVSAVALFVAVPALAADPGGYRPPLAPTPLPFVTGDLSMALGTETFSGIASFSEHYGVFSGDARANMPLSGMINLQLELAGDADAFDGGFSMAAYTPTAHLWARMPGGAFGAFGGATFGNFAFFTTDVVGAEGEVYLNNLTIGAQGAYNWGNAGPSDFNYWNVRGYLGFYITPDAKFQVDGKYTDFGGVLQGLTSWDVSGLVEARLPSMPLSVFGRAAYTSWNDGFQDVHAWRAVGGVKVLLDPPGTSLVSHDRSVPFNYVNSAALFVGPSL